MVKRKTPQPGGDDRYRVGYGKPPVHSRFQPGQSGNPAGRRKGVRNLMTDVGRILVKPVRLKEGGRTRQRTTQESVLLVLREKALRGDARALDRLLDLAQRLEGIAEPAVQPLPADDHAILDAYAAEYAAAAIPPAPPSSSDSSAPTSRGQPRKKRTP